MRGNVLTWICAMMIVSSAFTVLSLNVEVEGKSIVSDEINYIVSTPFRIDSDAELAASPKVSAGDGSPGNPWIIENFDIDGTFYSDCIYIGNVTDHLIIRDCYLHDAFNGDTWPYYMDAGLTLYNVENIVIDNNTIENNWQYGIYISDNIPKVGNNTIKNNTIHDNPRGIQNTQSENNRIQNNTLFNNSYYAIDTWFSSNNYIENNTIINYANMEGIKITDSSSIICYGNNMTECSFNIQAMQIQHWNTHEIYDTNTVNGKPIYYYKNQTSGAVPTDAGQVILANCTNMDIADIDASNGSAGIEIGFSSWNTIEDCVISNNTEYGCYLYTANNITIDDNVINNNGGTGGIGIMSRASSNNNTISNNTFTDNAQVILTQQSIFNTYENNDVTGSAYGISLSGGGYHTVQGNNIFSNQRGLNCGGSTNNLIMENIIKDNTVYGLEFSFSATANLIYHNDVINNTVQATDAASNLWNGNYPVGGNYWSNYSGADTQSGVNQDIPAADGFGDTPFIMDADSNDNYPLMEPVYQPTYVPHLPIRINSNADFDQAHGVANWDTGNGTAGNPWIIENWEINGTGYGYCIYVGNTTEYLIIKNCVLEGANGVDSSPYYYDSAIIFYLVQNAKVTEVITHSNYHNGIYLRMSDFNIIENNTAFNNDDFGIYIGASSNDNLVSNNTAYSNAAGILLGYGNTVMANNIVNNNSVSENLWGIELGRSWGNTITNNSASQNTISGIWAWDNSDYNTIANNTVFDNMRGIWISTNSDYNLVYSNYIIDNTNQAQDEVGTNMWNATYPTGGNYWSDYSGVDLFSGSNQDIPGVDGFGDTPYTNIAGIAGGQDNYPLMEPFGGVPPTSSVDPIFPYWHTSFPLTISATASDVGSGVNNVTLWYRYSADNVSWNGWTDSGLVDNSPWDGVSWSFNFPDNDGYYEFYSIAVDNTSIIEAAPGTADTGCCLDSTQPTVVLTTPLDEATSVSTTAGTYAINFSEAMDTAYSAVITDLPGVMWAWSADGRWLNRTYTTLAESTTYNIDLSVGGFRDLVGNVLTGDMTFNFTTGDFTAPTSSVDAIPQYWQVSTPLTINASDDGSGISDVTLWYRYSADNLTWNAWTSYGQDTASSWNWIFDFPDVDGYYEFYSIANDTAGNNESAPATADTSCAYDPTPPTVTDESPATGTTGDNYELRFICTDNLKLSAGYMVYWFGNGAETNTTIPNFNTYDNYLAISIPLDSLEPLHYRLAVVDEAGNWFSSSVKDVTIIDNDAPTANAGMDFGGTVIMTVGTNGLASTDNIGIENYTWSLTYNGTQEEVYGPYFNFTFRIPGNYTVSLAVSDAAGNTGTDTLTVIVHPSSTTPVDSDDDGVPDTEDDFPNDPSETTDTDGDGTGDNADAFPNDPNETTDTDGDGVGDNADAFPNDENETLDTDGDGTGDNADTDDDDDGVPDEDDPDSLNPDVTGDDGIGEYWWIILIIIIALVFAVILFYKMKAKKPEPLDEETEEIEDYAKQSPEES